MSKILYVDDNDDNIYLMVERLRRNGYEVCIAADGAEGLTAVATESPDLILMDLKLPIIDGWEATRRLKDDPATRNIPVIILSAHAMVTDRDRAFEAGCDDYETMPVDMTMLLNKIRRLLGTDKP